MVALRGVNLGGWLVLEQWITPGLFAGTDAKDEFSFCETADKKQLQRLVKHRRTFITKRDFRWLSEQGIDVVRLPVGYWVFGDAEPYQATVKYVDQAFAWAKAYDIKILLCLHGAPGSQNGKDHSGRIGDVAWSDNANRQRSLKIIGCLAGRYANHPALLGIELLNEPGHSIPRRLLRRYYRRAYHEIRKRCGPHAWVVFSDRYQLRRWTWSFQWPFYKNMYLDTHQYQVFDDADKRLGPAGHVAKSHAIGRALRRIGRHRKLIVGEWSGALDRQSLQGLEAPQTEMAYLEYLEAQLEAYGHTSAWFYWTYRTEDENQLWNFRDTVTRGRLALRTKPVTNFTAQEQ